MKQAETWSGKLIHLLIHSFTFIRASSIPMRLNLYQGQMQLLKMINTCFSVVLTWL